jgi:hypothetical protein
MINFQLDISIDQTQGIPGNVGKVPVGDADGVPNLRIDASLRLPPAKGVFVE